MLNIREILHKCNVCAEAQKSFSAKRLHRQKKNGFKLTVHPGNQTEIILDSIADGVFTVDLDFQITSFNRAAEEITGFSRNTAIGQACSDVFKADVCSGACILKQALAEKKAIVHRPVHILRTDQKRIPISVNATLLKNKAGNVIGGVETFRDLTSVQKLRQALLKQHSFSDIVSKNEKMNKIFSILPRIAESSSTALITGQSGTGKELIARAIHNHSPQKDGPFIAVNCGAIPETLLDSELFGHERGAFTGAEKLRIGRFEQANKGTIFLDGAAKGEPFMDASRGIYNLDHHEGCVRSFTLSTCEQAMILIRKGLDLDGERPLAGRPERTRIRCEQNAPRCTFSAARSRRASRRWPRSCTRNSSRTAGGR